MNPESLVAHVSRLWTSLSGRQIATLAAAFVAVVGVVVGSAYWVGAPSYAVLYTDLDPESAAAVVARLKAANTPYQLEQGGRSVLVPDSRLDEMRLDLASQGLPASGRIGFEIFDRTSFGTTEFLEHVNYRRGLEGELARTISTISEVQSARVHIALAKDSLFAGAAEQAKASVVLRLRNQRPLAPATVAGIAGLVAASVESLRPESVVIVDTFGRPLSRTEEAADSAAGGGAIERQQRIERELSTKVVALLEPVLGAGHVRVNVSAPLTFASEEQTEERWDPESVIRSRQTSSDTSTAASAARGGALAGGVAGARANAPPEASTATAAAPVAPSTAQSGRTTETVNYEISRTTTHTTSPGGRVARLSVAVLVDNVRVPGENGAAATSKPRETAEIERIQRLVAAAVGLDTERGDQLTVENIAFDEAPEALEPEAPAPWWRQVSPTVVSVLGMSVGDLLRWVMVFVLGLVALLAILRPLARTAMTPGLVPAAPAGASARTVAELEHEMQARVEAEAPARRDPGRLPALTKRLSQQAEQKPEHVAQLVRAWIAQEDK